MYNYKYKHKNRFDWPSDTKQRTQGSSHKQLLPYLLPVMAWPKLPDSGVPPVKQYPEPKLAALAAEHVARVQPLGALLA
jgi:hypothetical protein